MPRTTLTITKLPTVHEHKGVPVPELGHTIQTLGRGCGLGVESHDVGVQLDVTTWGSRGTWCSSRSCNKSCVSVISIYSECQSLISTYQETNHEITLPQHVQLPGAPGGHIEASKESPGGPLIPLIPSIPAGPGGPLAPGGPSAPAGPWVQEISQFYLFSSSCIMS